MKAIFAQPLKKVKFAILPVVLVSLEFRTGDVLRFKPPEEGPDQIGVKISFKGRF